VADGCIKDVTSWWDSYAREGECNRWWLSCTDP